MKILIVHNYYQQPGGEDKVVSSEAELLEKNGHKILRYEIHNNAIENINALRVAIGTIWNSDSYNDIYNITKNEAPDIVHFHNTFPLISPAGYYAAKNNRVAVVQTLHNYRLMCPAGTLYRNGKVCEDCIGRAVAWPAIRHACYRESRSATAVVVAMLSSHRLIRTLQRKVDVYIAISDSARRKFIESGLSSEKIVVKPNFIEPDPGPGDERGDYALFVGRLSREKGIDTLLAAWEKLGGRINLRIVGDGPLATKVADQAARFPSIKVLGRMDNDGALALMGTANFLIFPSEWHETFGLVVVEACARETPVIASRLGAMSEIIRDRDTGLHFEAGSAEDLATTVRWAINHPTEMRQMGKAARKEYLENYTGKQNYQLLTQIYEQAIEKANLKGR
jgi:glycosyltransferase involved in cell wall biosynthesis